LNYPHDHPSVYKADHQTTTVSDADPLINIPQPARRWPQYQPDKGGHEDNKSSLAIEGENIIMGAFYHLYLYGLLFWEPGCIKLVLHSGKVSSSVCQRVVLR
jgi:hypothetical protein